MSSLPLLIYLKHKTSFGLPITLEQFVLSYPKKERAKWLQTSGMSYCITEDGKPVTRDKALKSIEEMENKLESYFFERCFSRSDFARYLEEYPEGKFVPHAHDMIERLDFNMCHTPGEFAQYLNRYPKGQFVSRAEERLAGAVPPASSSGTANRWRDRSHTRRNPQVRERIASRRLAKVNA